MSGGRVPVTGANGHLGGNAIRELLDSGYTPVAFVRKGADVRALEHLDLERVEGDILDAESLRAGAAAASSCTSPPSTAPASTTSTR